MKKLLLICVLFFLNNSYSQVNTEKYRKRFDDTGFHAAVSLSGGLNKGNSEFVTVLGDVRLDYVAESSHYFIVSNYEFKEADRKKIINKGFVHLRGIYTINSQLFLEAFLQKEFNDFILLNDRNLIGAGGRFNMLKIFSPDDSLKNLKLFLGVGAMYENEVYNTANADTESNLIRSTNYLSFNWNFDERFDFNMVAYYQPVFKEFNDFRITMESGINFLITTNLGFTASLIYRYDNQPPDNIKKYDLELLNGITFFF